MKRRYEKKLPGEIPGDLPEGHPDKISDTLPAVLINPYGEADPVWGPPAGLPAGGAKDVIENLQRVVNAQITSTRGHPLFPIP
ncbi:MAG: hypothetical protein ACLFNZ_04270 [Spirochaetaceae bacterium]